MSLTKGKLRRVTMSFATSDVRDGPAGRTSLEYTCSPSVLTSFRVQGAGVLERIVRSGNTFLRSTCESSA